MTLIQRTLGAMVHTAVSRTELQASYWAEPMLRPRGRFPLVVVASVLLLTASCSSDLSRSDAEGLLRESPFIEEAATTHLVLYENKVFPIADFRASHRDLDPFLDLGLIDVVPRTVMFGKGVGARAVLSAKGERAAAEGWTRDRGPAGQEAWRVVTARKQFIGLIRLETAGDSAEVEFEWRWVPTGLGSLSRLPSGSQRATARFQRWNDSWHLGSVSSS